MQPAPARSPYVDLDRAAWVRLAESTPLPFTEADVERLRGLGDPIDLPEADGRRDGSGVPGSQPIAACAGPLTGSPASPDVAG